MTKVDATMKVIDETLSMLQNNNMDPDEQFGTGVLNLLSDMALSLSVIADRVVSLSVIAAKVTRKEIDNE